MKTNKCLREIKCNECDLKGIRESLSAIAHTKKIQKYLDEMYKYSPYQPYLKTETKDLVIFELKSK